MPATCLLTVLKRSPSPTTSLILGKSWLLSIPVLLARLFCPFQFSGHLKLTKQRFKPSPASVTHSPCRGSNPALPWSHTPCVRHSLKGLYVLSLSLAVRRQEAWGALFSSCDKQGSEKLRGWFRLGLKSHGAVI